MKYDQGPTYLNENLKAETAALFSRYLWNCAADSNTNVSTSVLYTDKTFIVSGTRLPSKLQNKRHGKSNMKK